MTRTLSYRLFCAVVSILVFGSSLDAGAATSQPDSTDVIHLNVKGFQLERAVNHLAEEADLDLAYDPGLLAGLRSDCEISTDDLDEAFRCVLAGTGLIHRRLQSGGYVIVKSGTASPSKNTVSGFLQDATSGERFVGANVYAPDLLAGTATNTYGFYSLTLPSDSIRLVFSYLGYKTVEHRLMLNSDQRLDVSLEPITMSAAEVVVSAARSEPLEAGTRMSTVEIPIRQVQSMPTIIGETDLVKAFQLMPGVRSGTEGTSGLYVRGGSPDQTLILLDGATVYNASHFFGLFSVFNADAIRHAELIKGGFPARYGGRLSSVLDVGMKEGNMKRIGGEFAIGAAASRIMVEGPIIKDRTSFIVSGRRTYIDGLLKPFQPDDESVGVYFYDLNAKINHKLSERDQIYLSLYRGNDRFSAKEDKISNKSDGHIQWGNVTSTFRWNRVLGSKLFSNFMATYTNYNFDVQVEEEDVFDPEETYKLAYTSGVRDFSVSADFDYLPAPHHFVRTGTKITQHTFSPGATQFRVSLDTDEGDQIVNLVPAPQVHSWEAAVYAEDDVKLSNRLKVNLGVHASAYNVSGETFSSVEPRVSARYLLPGGWGLKASYAAMKQYVLLLTNSSVGLPTDLWLPVTSRVPPQRSTLYAAGVSKSIAGGEVEASLEGYYKEMDGLIEYKNGANFVGIDQDWQNKIEFGRGRSYGVELLLQKKSGRTSGWIGYTLSWADRTFENLNGGETFPFRYDGRHDLALVAMHNITRRTEFSFNWVYTTGNAVTLPTTVYFINPYVDARECFCTVETPGRRGNYRQAAHHRLDVALNLHWYGDTGRTQTLSFGAYNAYNRKNPFFVYWEDRGDLRQFTLFPIIPYVTYRRSF